VSYNSIHDQNNNELAMKMNEYDSLFSPCCAASQSVVRCGPTIEGFTDSMATVRNRSGAPECLPPATDRPTGGGAQVPRRQRE